MPTNEPGRRRGIAITAAALACVAVGLYVVFVLITWLRA